MSVARCPRQELSSLLIVMADQRASSGRVMGGWHMEEVGGMVDVGEPCGR